MIMQRTTAGGTTTVPLPDHKELRVGAALDHSSVRNGSCPVAHCTISKTMEKAAKSGEISTLLAYVSAP
jgi:hypothetical protein